MAKKKPTAVVKPQKIDSIANIAADLKKELVKNPKEVLNAIEMDFNIAKDKKQKDVTLGQLLESIPATKRNGIAAALVDFIVTNEKVAAVLGKEIGKIIPGDIQIVDENIIRPIPIIPRPIPPIPKPKIISPVVDVNHLELQLAEVERIRKNLPKNATKAEKKAAANAEQQIKNLLKAAKRAEPKAVKKAVAKKTTKKTAKKKK